MTLIEINNTGPLYEFCIGTTLTVAACTQDSTDMHIGIDPTIKFIEEINVHVVECPSI